MSAPRRKGVLAIDHGSQRCGFAVADGLRIAAIPLDPVRYAGRIDAALSHIERLLAERDIDTFLVGWPLHMDGSAGARATDVQRFVDALVARFPAVRVVRYDERLTSKAAEELLREAGHRGPEMRARRDSWSALVLLRDWIASGEPA